MVFQAHNVFILTLNHSFKLDLSYDVASGSEITACNIIDKTDLQIFGKRNDVHDNVAHIMTKL